MSVQQGAAFVGMNDQRASTGKGSRFNAVKHGLTAKTPVLPGEDPAELQAKIDEYTRSHQVRNQAEADLAKLAAMACWRAERANRLEVNRVTGDIVRRSRAHAAQETLAAEGLGDRLLFDRRGPSQLYPSRDYEHKEPRTSDSGVADDPDKPRRLVIQLEATRAGRRWLLDRLDEVRKPIDSGEGWLSCQKLKAIRLLGKQPLDALFDREAALVFLASHAIRPAFKSAFRELRCEIHYDRVKFHEGQLSRPELRSLTPANAAAGRAVLLAIIDQAIERLWRLEAEHGEGDEILEMVETNAVSDAEAKNVGQIQRHLESSNRLVIRNLETIKRWHRWEDDGWGKARREREKLREQARRGHMHDLRFVLDERGTVRDAQGYDGDLEAGLARWKAERGRQPCEDPYDRAAGAGGESYTRGIPSDVSAKPEQWRSQGQAEASTDRPRDSAARDGNDQEGPGATQAVEATDDGALNQDAVAAAESRDGATDLGQAGLNDFVPLTLTGQEPATNIQNEIDGLEMDGDGGEKGAGDRVGGADDLGACESAGTDLGDDGGQEETCGRGDGGVGDPRRTATHADDGGQEETCGRGDGGVGDPRRTATHADGGGQEETCGRGDGGVRVPRRTVSEFVPLTLIGQEPATNIQNEIVGEQPRHLVGDRPIENLEAGEQEGGETGCQKEVEGDDLRAPLPEEGCVVPPRAPKPVSKRERRRRRREMARKEHERRRGVIQKGPDVSVDEMLDGVERKLPNSVAFLRKHMPRSP